MVLLNLDDIGHLVNCAKTTKDRLILAHNGNQSSLRNANVSVPLEHGFSRDTVKIFLKIYKAAVDFRRMMLCILNDGPEGKDVVNGLMSRSESCLSPTSQGSLIKHLREFRMENRDIELQERVAHHDRHVVVGIRMGPDLCIG
jgi:hypothetical protein